MTEVVQSIVIDNETGEAVFTIVNTREERIHPDVLQAIINNKIAERDNFVADRNSYIAELQAKLDSIEEVMNV